MTDTLIDLKDLSQQLKIPVRTIRNKISNGTWPLPPVRIGRALRWRQSDVDRLKSDGAPIVPAAPKRQYGILECSNCESDRDVHMLAWVNRHGTAIEAAGDYNEPPEQEPRQLAFCGRCEVYFRPSPDQVYRIVKGKPVVELVTP